MEREHPQLWHDLPPRVREGVHARVQEQLPQIVHEMTGEIGSNIDQLLDVKLMVIRHIEEHPELGTGSSSRWGARSCAYDQLRVLLRLLQGIPLVFITQAVPTGGCCRSAA